MLDQAHSNPAKLNNYYHEVNIIERHAREMLGKSSFCIVFDIAKRENTSKRKNLIKKDYYNMKIVINIVKLTQKRNNLA